MQVSKIKILYTILLALLLLSFAVKAQPDSLRGERAVNEPSANAQITPWQNDKEPIQREYLQQPPLVPHSIEGYRINLKFNKCLTCHSWANYIDAKATKISQTHFVDRDGQVLANISPRRYFCPQCHVPQADQIPIVENTFKPVKAIKSR